MSAIKSDNAIETATPSVNCVFVKAKKTEETEVSQGRDNRWEFWRERGRWRLREVGLGGRRGAIVSRSVTSERSHAHYRNTVLIPMHTRDILWYNILFSLAVGFWTHSHFGTHSYVKDFLVLFQKQVFCIVIKDLNSFMYKYVSVMR